MHDSKDVWISECQILWDLASTYVLRWPCSLSLYFRRSQSSKLSDLVMNKRVYLKLISKLRFSIHEQGSYVLSQGSGLGINN